MASFPEQTIVAMMAELGKKYTLIERCAYTAQLGITLMDDDHLVVAAKSPMLYAVVRDKVRGAMDDLKLASLIGMVDNIQYKVYNDLLAHALDRIDFKEYDTEEAWW